MYISLPMWLASCDWVHAYIHTAWYCACDEHAPCSVYTLQTDNDQCIVVQICRHVADIVIALVLTFDRVHFLPMSISGIMLHWSALHPHLQPHLGKVPSSHDCCCCCYCCSNTWCHSMLQTVLPPLHPTTQIEQRKAPHVNYYHTLYTSIYLVYRIVCLTIDLCLNSVYSYKDYTAPLQHRYIYIIHNVPVCNVYDYNKGQAYWSVLSILLHCQGGSV